MSDKQLKAIEDGKLYIIYRWSHAGQKYYAIPRIARFEASKTGEDFFGQWCFPYEKSEPFNLPRHEKDLFYLVKIPDGVMEQEYSYTFYIYKEKIGVYSKIEARISGTITAMSEKKAKEQIYSMFETTLPQFPKENRAINIEKV